MDELVTAINALLALVPEQHRALVMALISVMAALYTTGAFWAGVRFLVAKKLPAGREPGWFQAVDLLMQAITASSSRVSQRPVQPKEKP